jgi:SulP family sulfate permease
MAPESGDNGVDPAPEVGDVGADDLKSSTAISTADGARTDGEPIGRGQDAGPAYDLSRRPAIDYHLEPESNAWFLTLLKAATPGWAFLRERYQRSWLSRDAMAGLAVSSYLIPQVMAYSAIVGVPPVTGLWTCLIAMLVYVVVGGSRVLSVGPESTIALLAGLSVAGLAQGDPSRVIELSAALSLLVAAWCFVGRILRLGVIADLLSEPLLVGYLAGAAALMIAGQLGKLTRTEVEGESIISQVMGYASTSSDTHPATVAVGLATFVAILAIHYIRPKWPAALLGVVGSMVAYVVLGLDDYGVSAVGEVPSGVPTPSLPEVSGAEFQQLVVAGLGVAIMAYSDNMLFARAFPSPALPGERPSDREVDPQNELAALGTVHVVVGFFGGFPVSSSGSRTALAVASRAKTQVYSLVAAACVLVVILLAGSITTMLPNAALGAVVVYAATKLVHIDKFIRLFRFRRREFLLAVTTLVGTVVYGILAGVGLAVALALLDMGQRMARPRSAVLGRVPGVAGMHSVVDYPNAQTLPGLIIYRYDAPLFFANIGDLRRSVQRIIDEERTAYPGQPLRWLLLNVEAVSQIDITACDGLEDLQTDLAAQDIRLGFVRIKNDLYQALRRSGVINETNEDMLFPTLPVAEERYLEWARRNPVAPTTVGTEQAPVKEATGPWTATADATGTAPRPDEETHPR